MPSLPLRSLRAKWSLLFFLLAVAPLALLAPFTLRVQRAGLERTEKELEAAVVDEASRAIVRLLSDAAQATHRTAEVLTDGRIADDEGRLTVARDAVANAPSLEYVAIYGADGAYIDAIARGAHETDVAPPSRVPPPGPGRPEARWVAESTAAGVELTYFEPMDREHERRGWIAGRLSSVTLRELLTSLAETRFGRADRLVVVDDDLRVIAAPGAPALIGQSLRGRDAFTNVSAPGEGVALTTEFLGEGGEPMVGTVWSVPDQKWAVVVRRPQSEAFGALVASRRAFLLAASAAAALALVLGAVFAARTTRPIRDLVELTRAYARREFTRRSPVTSKDELGELGHSMSDMADSLAAGEVEIARRATVEAGLARYMPAEIAKAIAAGKRSLDLGGERRTISIVFADVASFTSFAENATPENVVGFLNELFTILSEVVFRHGGMVDKFMGDCVMALFGASGDAASDAGHAAAATTAAEDMQRFVEASAPAWKERFGVDVRLGIGVATGEAIVGNLGSDVRMEFTAIGDAVNVASRLETLARPGQVLVTRDVVDAAGAGFAFRSLGEHAIRGKKKAIEVFEIETE